MPRTGKARGHLSAIIKEKRIEAGLTQKDMGELSGVSLKAIREIEQGREENVTVASLKKILAYFGLQLTLIDNQSISEPLAGVIPFPELMERLRSIKKAISKTYGIKEIRLFGSYARGEAKDESDVDVILVPERPLTFKEIVRMEKIFEEVLGHKKIDIVIEKEMDPSVRASAEKDFKDV